MAELVRIEGIIKDYQMGGEKLRVLKGVDLVIQEGEFVSLMGPSGSGKSTLMNILGCLDRPSFGRYFLGEVDVSSMSDDELSEVRCNYLGFIFQSYNLIPQYTVVENIELPLLYQGVTINQQTKARCEALARMVGLGERLDHRPLQLSGGQQQRVAIARSLVNNPQVILGDEPTGNLDSKTSVEIMQTLASLNRAGKTIIMVTHENDIAEWSKRIVRLKDGMIESDTENPHPRTR